MMAFAVCISSDDNNDGVLSSSFLKPLIWLAPPGKDMMQAPSNMPKNKKEQWCWWQFKERQATPVLAWMWFAPDCQGDDDSE